MTDLSPIEAHERVVGRIFCDDYTFEIPPYQRPYAWETEQARDLLTDLLEAMDDTATSDYTHSPSQRTARSDHRRGAQGRALRLRPPSTKSGHRSGGPS